MPATAGRLSNTLRYAQDDNFVGKNNRTATAEGRVTETDFSL